MFLKHPDPEEVRWIDQIWRYLYCVGNMVTDHNGWGHREQQIMDAQYCLDRYSLREDGNAV
jgi:hypothetical protein